MLKPLALLDQLCVAGLVGLQGFETLEDGPALGCPGFDLAAARQDRPVGLDATTGVLGLRVQGLGLLQRASEVGFQSLGLLALAPQAVALLLECGAPGREFGEVGRELLQRCLGDAKRLTVLGLPAHLPVQVVPFALEPVDAASAVAGSLARPAFQALVEAKA